MSETSVAGDSTESAQPGPLESPLRICVCTVAGHGVGGMQRHTHDLVRGLVNVGHNVEVICPASDELDEDLYRARWHLVDTTGRSDPEWRAKFRTAFLHADALDPFDVIHSESTSAVGLLHPTVHTPIAIKYHGNYLGLAKAHVKRMTTRPRTAVAEGKTLLWLTRAHFRNGNAWAFRNCESMVVSRQQLRDTSLSHLIRPGLIHVVPNGIDAARFSPGDRDRAREGLGLPGGTLLASVGRLNREKGFDVAIEALSRIAPDFPDTTLVVVGDGEDRKSLGRLAEARGVADRVLFAGRQDQAGVTEHLRASDIFLFPTIREEAAPLVLPEAMACGLPVIASRIGGIPEVVDPEDGPAAGFLTHPGSVDELVAAIRRLLGDPVLQDEYGRRARARVLEEYTLEKMVSRTAAVYRAAIERRAGARR